MASLTLNLEPRWSRAVSFTLRSIYLRYQLTNSVIRFGIFGEKSVSADRNRSPDLPELSLVTKPTALYRMSENLFRNVEFVRQSGNSKAKCKCRKKLCFCVWCLQTWHGASYMRPIKVKVTPEQATKAQSGCRGITLPFL